MSVNRGKQFEQQVKKALEKLPDTSVDRLIDPTAGFAGVGNISDFIVYNEPAQIYVECKAYHGNTLNFKAIRPNQWKGLQEKSDIKGVHAGVLVWFIDHDITCYVPIKNLVQLVSGGKKSIHYTDITENNVKHYKIPAKKMRVLFDYDFTNFFEEIRRLEDGQE